ncbi:alpha/beta hydrolase [Bacillus sp. REN10]|uniref:alpha/beta hydrolase n=1 Tax=Bacillus sp. REN10 TaxID=2782541 RepID=UPI00193C847F|nr:alpha/beta hydrolase [Bacillus sp. REN10]
MLEKEYWVTMSDGYEVFLTEWTDEAVKPKAVLQIAHGMAEHIKRYRRLAQYLASQGFVVYGNDHRGHGQTGEKSGLLGFFAEENGFERVTEDLKEINDHIHRTHPDLPVFLMGHSMGSFLIRRYLQRFPRTVHGVILSGTGSDRGLLGKAGKMLAKVESRRRGKRTKSPLLNQLSFGNFNKKLSNVQTEFDWLSRDREQVQAYIDDPYCGFIPTAGFFYDLLSGLEKIHKREEVSRMEKDLPFFFISGDQDPVGDYSKGVLRVIHQYKQQGITNIHYQLYQEGRHEMLNETNSQQVIEDITNWLQAQL